jgi:hypothetical protein
MPAPCRRPHRTGPPRAEHRVRGRVEGECSGQAVGAVLAVGPPGRTSLSATGPVALVRRPATADAPLRRTPEVIAPDHLRRRRPAHRPLLLPGHPQGRQRQLHRLSGPAAGRLPGRASGGGDLRQRHPPLQDRRAVAGCPSSSGRAARGALQPPRQPGRAHLGCAQGLVGQQPDLDHSRAAPPGACLLPRSQPSAVAGHRRPPQLTVAARRFTCRTSGKPLSTGRRA